MLHPDLEVQKRSQPAEIHYCITRKKLKATGKNHCCWMQWYVEKPLMWTGCWADPPGMG